MLAGARRRAVTGVVEGLELALGRHMSLGDLPAECGEALCGERAAQGHEDRVVAGNGAQHGANVGRVQGQTDGLSPTRSGAKDDQHPGVLGGHEELANELDELRSRRHGRDGRVRQDVAIRSLDHPQSMQVARERGLLGSNASLTEPRSQLLLAVESLAADQLSDELPPASDLAGRAEGGGLGHVDDYAYA